MTNAPASRRTAPGVRVDPFLIFGVSLFVALAVSWPTLSGAMRGGIDIVQAGVHLLVAVAVSWAGCYAVGSLLHGYAQSAAAGNDPASPRTPLDGVPDRRATDLDLTALAAPPAALEPSADREPA